MQRIGRRNPPLARLRPDTLTVHCYFSDPGRGFQLPTSLPGCNVLPRRFMAKMMGPGYVSAGLLSAAEDAFATVFTRVDSRVMRRLRVTRPRRG